MESINCFELKKYMNGRMLASVEEPAAWVSSLAIATKKVWSLEDRRNLSAT